MSVPLTLLLKPPQPSPKHPKLMTPPTTTVSAATHGGSAAISDVDVDVLREHIFTRLDGPALASASCACSEFHALSAEESLWAHTCSATWPSTDTPHLRHVIGAFPNGPRSFYAHSFPILAIDETSNNSNNSSDSNNPDRPINLISAVDIRYRDDVVLSKLLTTETASGWFENSPFRVDLVDPKGVVPTSIPYPETDPACSDLADDVRLSWIVIDPIGRRAANMSSRAPVSADRHWLTGEVRFRFAVVVGAVQVGVLVTCGRLMEVREVSLQVEDMDGKNLNGRDSLGILHGALGGKMGIRRNVGEEEGKRRYEEYLERRRERKERKARSEGRLDTLCVAFSVIVVALSSFLFLCT